MKQVIDIKKLNVVLLDIILYNILTCSEKNNEFCKITTYKELLLYLLSSNSNEFLKYLNDPTANIVKKSFFSNKITYCNKIYEYKTPTIEPCDTYSINDMSYNREYHTLDIFIKILKFYKLKSLNVKINYQVLDLILNAIVAMINNYSDDISIIKYNLDRFDCINYYICSLLDKSYNCKNAIQKKSIDNTLKHRQLELKKINNYKIKYDNIREIINKLEYFKLLLTSMPVLNSF